MPENRGTLTVNGKPHPFAEGMTVAALVTELPGSPGAVVVEVNGAIIPRENFATMPLHDGDNIEVVHFVGGG